MVDAPRRGMIGFVADTREAVAARASRRMRWAFVGICAALSVVLAGSMLSNFFGARQLVDTVVRGQGAMLFHLLHRSTRGPSIPSESEVRRVFDEGAELGLRYVALVSPRGVLVEVGTPVRPLSARDLPRSEPIERDGAVVRAWSPLGQPPGPPPPPPEGKRFGPPHRPPPRAGARFVVEFEPTHADAMSERAWIDLAVGLGSLVVLWAGAFAFWRVSSRASSAEAELAHKQHLATLGEMSAVIAHELRNPLASLKGNAQLLAEQANEPKLQRKADRVVDEAVRLQALTNGLLDFVRSGRVQPAPTPVGELAREAVAGSIAVVEVELGEAPPMWSLDRTRMRQVLVNLLDNAHHAAPESAATLRVWADAATLSFEVRDRGPGVPQEQRASIFAAFHTGRTQGTGLGLAVAHRIVAEHGGTIVCDEHPSGGALFTVSLPR